MIAFILSELFKHVLVPIAVLWASYNYMTGFIDFQNSFLITNVILTISTVPLLIWQLIKLIPNLALLRARAIIKSVIRTAIQIGSVVGFWAAFIIMFY